MLEWQYNFTWFREFRNFWLWTLTSGFIIRSGCAEDLSKFSRAPRSVTCSERVSHTRLEKEQLTRITWDWLRSGWMNTNKSFTLWDRSSRTDLMETCPRERPLEKNLNVRTSSGICRTWSQNWTSRICTRTEEGRWECILNISLNKGVSF